MNEAYSRSQFDADELMPKPALMLIASVLDLHHKHFDLFEATNKFEAFEASLFEGERSHKTKLSEMCSALETSRPQIGASGFSFHKSALRHRLQTQQKGYGFDDLVYNQQTNQPFSI